MNKSKLLSKIILQPYYKESLSEIRKVNLTITQIPKLEEFDFSANTFPQHGNIKLIEEISRVNLDPENGQRVAQNLFYSAYDESKLNYSTLEGSAYFTSHSLVVSAKQEYLPITYLSFYFYTRSQDIANLSTHFKHSEDHKTDSNFDYIEDRNEFLNQWIIEDSISLIDGPLIGGNLSSYTVTLVEELHKRNIIPIFVIKNSDSNLLTDNIPTLRDKFNSDLHWSYNFLKIGQRTNYVLYIDEYNPKNAKIFCYLKAFNRSPQRIEFHADTFNLYREKVNDFMDLIYYLLLVQGDKKNPQVRPIAIAEKYSREVLIMANSYNLIKESGLIPTIDQERFGR